MQGEQEDAEEVVAYGALEEGDESGIEVGMVVAAEPVLQSGARRAGLALEVALRGIGTARLLEIVEGLGGISASPAEGGWRGGAIGVRLEWSHGSCPLVLLLDKATVGERAMLVQRGRNEAE
jgi:hypothetical protein